jgi:hypothetical protein
MTLEEFEKICQVVAPNVAKLLKNKEFMNQTVEEVSDE